jgi:hypothetical protein
VAQSLFEAQLVLHAVAPQAYAPQGVVVPALHVPEPLQVDAVVWLPPEQDAELPQTVPDA